VTPELVAALNYARCVPGEATLPVAARLLLELEAERTVSTPSESLLSVDQAAARMGVTRAWMYRHGRTLPFMRKISRRQLRFDPAGLEMWLAEKAAGGGEIRKAGNRRMETQHGC
jgi:predicted DNA-binding transcriptional regulator AlpA